MATNPNGNDTNGVNTPLVQINVSGPITVYYGGVNPPSTLDTKRLVRSVAAKLGAAALAGMSREELATLFGADDDTKSRGYMSGADADKVIHEAQRSRKEGDVPDAGPEAVDTSETTKRLEREPAGFDGVATKPWLREFAGKNGFAPDLGSRLHTAFDRHGVKTILAQHGVAVPMGDNGGYRLEDLEVAARLGDELVASGVAYMFGPVLNGFLQKLAASLGGSTVDEDKLMKELDKSNFRGSIDQVRLIKEAAKLGFPESVGIKAWELLDYNPEIIMFCEALQVPYPEVGMNGKFRVDDVRSLVRLEGFTNLPGLQARSRVYKVLSAL